MHEITTALSYDWLVVRHLNLCVVYVVCASGLLHIVATLLSIDT